MRPILIANQFLIIACGQLPYFVLGSPLCLRRPAVWPFTLANHLCGHFSMWSITPANHFLWPFCGPFVAFLWPFSGGASVRPILLANDLCGPFSIVRPFFSSERLNDSREPAKLCLLGHILHTPKMPSIIISIPKFIPPFNYHLPPLIAFGHRGCWELCTLLKRVRSVDLSQI
jgi:hypothetical protein